MNGVWKTKFGPRRVRQEPPTLEEAVAAASGLTDDLQQQVEIAASLMDLPEDQVRAAVTKAAAQRKRQIGTVGVTARSGLQRAVVVERKAARRPGVPRRFSV
ncbi:MAG: hypothetical protein GEU91_09685 [Rhizobiales bacterium]|nr:hypothetical protein [Hyphomicrobiales bacterium]